MKIPNLLVAAVVSAGLALSVAAQAKEKKKHEEQEITSSDVPSEVQQAAEKQAKGAKIVRWEKEGANYEAVIEKDGKEWGYKFDANGKLLSKRSEAGEKGEKGEKY
jgi:YD repeat-containing protein